MTYTIHLASRPGLHADYDPRTAPFVAEASSLRGAVSQAKREWKRGYAYWIKNEDGKIVRRVWENGSVT